MLTRRYLVRARAKVDKVKLCLFLSGTLTETTPFFLRGPALVFLYLCEQLTLNPSEITLLPLICVTLAWGRIN